MAYQVLEDWAEELIVPGIRRYADMTLVVDPAMVSLFENAMQAGEPILVRLDDFTVKAFVTKVSFGNGLHRVTLKPTGARPFAMLDLTDIQRAMEHQFFYGTSPCFDPHPNCRCVGITSTKEDLMNGIKKRKFCVGSLQAQTRDGRETLAQAIEHATRLVENTGEDQFIVKVIKVVRRKTPPIVVEDVK